MVHPHKQRRPLLIISHLVNKLKLIWHLLRYRSMTFVHLRLCRNFLLLILPPQALHLSTNRHNTLRGHQFSRLRRPNGLSNRPAKVSRLHLSQPLAILQRTQQGTARRLQHQSHRASEKLPLPIHTPNLKPLLIATTIANVQTSSTAASGPILGQEGQRRHQR